MKNAGPFRSGPTPRRNVLEAAVALSLALAVGLSLAVPTTEKYLRESRGRAGVNCAQFGAPQNAFTPESTLGSKGAASLKNSVTKAAEDQAEAFKTNLADFLLKKKLYANCEFPGFEPPQAYSWGGATHGYAPFVLCLLGAGVLGAAGLGGYHLLRQRRRSSGLRGPLFGGTTFWLLGASLVATGGIGVVLRLQLNDAWAHANAELEQYRVACQGLRDDLALSDAVCTARSDACVSNPKFTQSYALKRARSLEGVCRAPELQLSLIQDLAAELDKQSTAPGAPNVNPTAQPPAPPADPASGSSEAGTVPPPDVPGSSSTPAVEKKISEDERNRRHELVETTITTIRSEVPDANKSQIDRALRFAALGLPLALAVQLALLGNDDKSKEVETKILERTYTQIKDDHPVELSESEKDALIDLAKSDRNFKQMLERPIFARSREAAQVLANRECAQTMTPPARFCEQSTLQGAMSALGEICKGQPIDKEVVAFLECCECQASTACVTLNEKYKESNYACPKQND